MAGQKESEVVARARRRIGAFIDVLVTSGYGRQQMAQLTVGEIDLDGVMALGTGDDTTCGRDAKAKVTLSMTIDEECCNISGNAHGGFIAWLVDMTTSMPLLALNTPDSWLTAGVSSNINVYYLNGIPCGTKIQVVCTVVQKGRNTATIEARVEEAATGKLMALGLHTKVDTSRRSKL